MIQVYYLNIYLYYNMTQAEKFIKVQSLQSGNFTKTNSHVDFVIPIERMTFQIRMLPSMCYPTSFLLS